MQMQVTSINGKGGSTVELPEECFGKAFNEALVHQVVTAYMAGARAGSKAQKTRSEVSGGGIKPWRQKGTGRARAGTTRSPLWRTGGVTFAARPQDHAQKVNRKMYRGAMRSILSELIRQERLTVVDGLTLEAPKTRLLAAKLKEMGQPRALIVTAEVDENLYLASRNLVGVDACTVTQINPVALISYDHVIMTADAIKRVEEMLA